MRNNLIKIFLLTLVLSLSSCILGKEKTEEKTWGDEVSMEEKNTEDSKDQDNSDLVSVNWGKLNDTNLIEFEFQNDADLLRLEHLEYWTWLIEEYYDKVWYYPFQKDYEASEKIWLVRVATQDQQLYFDKDSDKYIPDLDTNYSKIFKEISMKDFVSEIEDKLGKEIEEKYDIQKVPTTSNNWYNYFVSSKWYLFWVPCITCGVTTISTLTMDGITPTVNIVSKWMLSEVPKSLTREEMLSHSVYKEWKSKDFYKEEYVRNLEKENINNSKAESSEKTAPSKTSEESTIFETKLYKIENPENWEKFTNQLQWLEIKWFLSPMESNLDVFRENINIIQEPLKKETTLKEYLDASIDWLKIVIPWFELQYSKESELSGLPAYEIGYTGNDNGYDFTWRQYITIKDNSAYILTYTKLSDNVAYDQISADMIESFELK